MFRESLCTPLSGVGKIFFLQYQSNTQKYTTSDLYWINNNLLFYIPFCIHNNLNIIIKIFKTIYLMFMVIFLPISLYWHHDSLVHKTRTFFHDTSKTGATSNRCFSTTIRPLRYIFTL